MDDRTTDEDIRHEFEKYGHIVEIRMRSTPRDTFAFVEFEEHSDAKKAIDEMDQAKIMGNQIKCNWASFKSPPSNVRPSDRGRFQIWVGKLHLDTDEQTIRRKFEEFGYIVSMQLRGRDRTDAHFAFVEYDSADKCENAIEAMHNQEFDGAQIVVDWSQRNRSQMTPTERRSGPEAKPRTFEVRSDSRDRSPRRVRRSPQKGKYRCELENLPPQMTWQDLKNLTAKMRGGEDITFARTFEDNGLPCGMIELQTRDGRNELMKDLDGKRINGYKIRMRKL